MENLLTTRNQLDIKNDAFLRNKRIAAIKGYRTIVNSFDRKTVLSKPKNIVPVHHLKNPATSRFKSRVYILKKR